MVELGRPTTQMTATVGVFRQTLFTALRKAEPSADGGKIVG